MSKGKVLVTGGLGFIGSHTTGRNYFNDNYNSYFQSSIG